MDPATMPDGAWLEGGFADPVLDAQAAFDAVMNAFARPGAIADLGGLATPPEPVPPAAGAFLAALADYDTPVWMDGAARSGGMREWLSFHTGAATVDEPATARFALVCDPARMPALDMFPQGTDAYPDRSATVLIALPSLEGGNAMILRGPGIETEAAISPRGLPDDFVDRWRTNNAAFPLGIDLLLAAGDRAVALPRTTRITRR